MALNIQPFRFRDLPGEIRNKIYCLLLCSFDSTPTATFVNIPREGVQTLSILNHAIETSILCASREVYREAYDVMIKTNRFVRVCSAGGVSLLDIISSWSIPVVTIDRQCVEQFKGYVLALSMHRIGYSPTQISFAPGAASSSGPISFIILARDMDDFCKAFEDDNEGLIAVGDPSHNLSMTITVAPVLTEYQMPLDDPLRDFFSELTQEDLLRPLRSNIRCVKNMLIRGVVSQHIATASQEEITKEKLLNGRGIIDKFTDIEERGNNFFRKGSVDRASLIWREAGLEIEGLLRNGSWHETVKHEGGSIAAELAEIYFLLQIHIARAETINMETAIRPLAGLWTANALDSAIRSMQTDFWIEDFTWTPSGVQEAKLWHRSAVYTRLQGSGLNHALNHINRALELDRRSPEIVKEQQLILSLSRGHC